MPKVITRLTMHDVNDGVVTFRDEDGDELDMTVDLNKNQPGYYFVEPSDTGVFVTRAMLLEAMAHLDLYVKTQSLQDD